KILHLSFFDNYGGAAKAAFRILNSQINQGIDSHMLVCAKFSKNKNAASKNLAMFISSIAQHIELNNGLEPSIKKIMSPKGTTYSGLKALKKNKISSVFKSAFKAAEKRSKEIQNEY
ncbi:MAG: pyrroline-5-carboxylate reductase dimerization domain-containing protein, partial [Gammaproteobacteria bacterium]